MSIPENDERQNYTAPGASAAYEPVTGAPVNDAGVPPAGGPYGYSAPPVPGAPNPGLAALLGFIPGVGAMYNGQFAKGIAHIAIFAIFSSLSKNVNGLFGLFVAGWIFYMVFEAYQTAVARRDGLPLPDPFGLNNVGERFGFRGNPDFSSFWAGHGTGVPPTYGATQVDPNGAVHAARVDAAGTQTSYQVDPNGTVYTTTAPGYAPPQTSTGYASTPYGAPPVYGVPPAYGVPPVYGAPPASQYATPPVPPMPPAKPLFGGLPIGALWLIGLGFFALLGSLHPFAFLEGEATGGIFLIGLSLFLFYRNQRSQAALYPTDSPAAKWSQIRGLRGPGVVMIIGVLTLLQGLHVIYWEQSWPFLLIFLGVLMLLERTAQSRMAATVAYPGYPGAPAAQDGTVETASPTSIIPKYTDTEHDLNREGR